MNGSKLLSILCVALLCCITSCTSKQPDTAKIFQAIKQNYQAELPDIKNIDTVYFKVDSVTKATLTSLQAVEYLISKIEFDTESGLDIIDTGNVYAEQHSAMLQKISDSIFEASKKQDSINVLYYSVKPLVIYTKQNLEKGAAESVMYFDKNYNLIPLSALVKKIAKNHYNEKPTPEDYIIITPEISAQLNAQGYKKYY